MYRGRAVINIQRKQRSIDVDTVDAIVVGGGPAGSTCAWKLFDAGLNVLLLDRAAFPRPKLCAGWVTPEVIADLELDWHDYPYGYLTFDKLYLHWKALSVGLRSRQHSIRRYEFDDFLLRRAGVGVLRHEVRKIQRHGADYIIDDQFRCKFLVGAGGTSCPVFRAFFHRLSPRCKALQTVTYEHEFGYEWRDARCHLWFFDGGLPGYAWYVPKANGHINIGLGGMADKLKRRGGNIRQYWRRFVQKLNEEGLVIHNDLEPRGYSYYLRGNVDIVTDQGAYIVGDSIGIATRDLCEGIGPAVKSGLLAARSIATGVDYTLDEIGRFSGGGLMSKMLERKFVDTQRVM